MERNDKGKRKIKREEQKSAAILRPPARAEKKNRSDREPSGGIHNICFMACMVAGCSGAMGLLKSFFFEKELVLYI